MDTLHDKPASDPQPDWMEQLAAALTDDELERAARAAFNWWRHRPAGVMDGHIARQLVELQHEFLRRFPDGDLSAPTAHIDPGQPETDTSIKANL